MATEAKAGGDKTMKIVGCVHHWRINTEGRGVCVKCEQVQHFKAVNRRDKPRYIRLVPDKNNLVDLPVNDKKEDNRPEHAIVERQGNG